MQPDIELDGKTRKQFHDALLSAFPSEADLEQMVNFELDENLNYIATGGNYSEVVFKLIKWAQAQGRIEELLTAARSANPGNPKLKSFDEQMRSRPNTNPTPVTANPKHISSSPESSDFDVFLAHNSSDKPQVEAVATELRQRGIKYWLDKEQIPPGRWFQYVIQEAIPNVKSAAIFIGVNAVGKWQKLELRSFINRCVEADIPVIPVLLPGVNKIPENLVFLQEFSWVKFSQSINEKEALDNLEWGITGKRPQ
ncbi:toll/interleukin-1 receptor domain-containing protein [Mastigocoleus testarum]|uniref:TIR domain-containing protein n=1 Tax=Mastigocoleus testarum BC008 TaxID=371196 RepID=A0A0V7ZJZ2_9CYAN|nr:toll/interleukin-1 receptor domain-containing protein [Mastigocoleus testarum]KST64922.1 hypothetical protein BC008_19105 [Mastigocoleus testarum BC008]KST65029.1 hypothetical protein BC008_19710 [Mastigocoleus testarum BC008]